MPRGTGLQAVRDRGEHYRFLTGAAPTIVTDEDEASPTYGQHNVTFDHNPDVPGLIATQKGQNAVVNTFNTTGRRPQGFGGDRGYYTNAKYDKKTKEVVLSGKVKNDSWWGRFFGKKYEDYERRLPEQEYSDIVKNSAESAYRSGKARSETIDNQKAKLAAEDLDEQKAKRAYGGAESFRKYKVLKPDGTWWKWNADLNDYEQITEEGEPASEEEEDSEGARFPISTIDIQRGVQQLRDEILAGEGSGQNAAKFGTDADAYLLDIEGLDPNDPTEAMYLDSALNHFILGTSRAQLLQTQIISHQGFEGALERINTDLVAGAEFSNIFGQHNIKEFPGFDNWVRMKKSYNTEFTRLTNLEEKLLHARASHSQNPMGRRNNPQVDPSTIGNLEAEVERITKRVDNAAKSLRDRHPITRLLEEMVIELEKASVLKRLAKHREQQP